MKPLINDEFLLQKMPGKGGWTFAVVPKVSFSRKGPSMWAKVKGTIDGVAFENLSLAPMRNGRLFFPVKLEIRKAINKQAGDTVRLVLFEDDSVFQIPPEIIDCLKLEEGVFQKFMALKENHQKEFINWINEAKLDETKAKRINIMIDKVQKDERLYPKEM